MSAKRELFAALIPLVLFWVVEEFMGLKAALIVGCAAAVIEISWELYKTKKISFLTASSNALVLGLGAVSFVMDNGMAFKLQPAVMEWGMAAMMLGSRFHGTREPFMVRTFRDAPVLDAEKRAQALEIPFFHGRLKGFDTRLIFFLLIHGLAVAWAAIWGGTRAWILLKGVLFYVLLVLIAVPMYRKPHANVGHSGATEPPK